MASRTYFFEQAGLPSTSSFDLSMGQYAINTGGVVIAWLLMASGEWADGASTTPLTRNIADFIAHCISGERWVWAWC